MSDLSCRERLNNVTETRSVFGNLTVKEARDDEGPGKLVFNGYASTYNQPYTVYDFFGEYQETMLGGAFAGSVAREADVVFLVNHTGLPLARTTAGNLRLHSDDIGLRVEAELNPEDPDVKAIVPKIRRGDITEMSLAFRVQDQTWNDDHTQRNIVAADLHRGDVSVVTYGANPNTTASLRAAIRHDPSFREAMRMLMAEQGMDFSLRDETSDDETDTDDRGADFSDLVAWAASLDRREEELAAKERLISFNTDKLLRVIDVLPDISKMNIFSKDKTSDPTHEFMPNSIDDYVEPDQIAEDEADIPVSDDPEAAETVSDTDEMVSDVDPDETTSEVLEDDDDDEDGYELDEDDLIDGTAPDDISEIADGAADELDDGRRWRTENKVKLMQVLAGSDL